MLTVFVTGGSGFIGSHLMNRLLDGSPVHVVGLSRGLYNYTGLHHRDGFNRALYVQQSMFTHAFCNLLDENMVKSVMNMYVPDMVFHLAGVSTVKLPPHDPYGHNLWKTNVDGTRHLLTYAPPKCRFVLASSATVYGEGMRAFESFEEDPPNPSSMYALSKLAAEELVNFYTRTGKVNGINLRYIANVGKNSTHGLLHDLVKKLRSKSETLDLLGDAPGSSKPYMHVKDTVDATVFLAGRSINETVNVATPDPMTVNMVAELAMEVSGIKKPIRWLGEEANWRGDNRCVNVSNEKLERLGWVPTYKHSGEAIAQAIKEILPCPANPE